MFTVIIPLYNKSAYIEKCLQSVIDQTFQDFEVIVVNDGSTDNGPDKVKEVIHQSLITNHQLQIKVIHQANSGVSTARNNGVKAAKYDYVAFLDADDWWDCHFLEEMKGLISKYPDAGMWGCNYYYVKNWVKRIEDKGLEASFKAGYIDYIKIYSSTFCVPINCSFVVVGREVFMDNSGFNTNLRFGEDFDLWVRIALKYKVAYLNKLLSYSNQDSDISFRAIGSKKVFTPSENVVFNLSHLVKEESQFPDLKKLLDGLRVRSLIGYHLNGVYTDFATTELNKVDFSKQPLYFRFIYCSPKWIVRFYLIFMRTGSKTKQYIFQRSRKKGVN